MTVTTVSAVSEKGGQVQTSWFGDPNGLPLLSNFPVDAVEHASRDE